MVRKATKGVSVMACRARMAYSGMVMQAKAAKRPMRRSKRRLAHR